MTDIDWWYEYHCFLVIFPFPFILSFLLFSLLSIPFFFATLFASYVLSFLFLSSVFLSHILCSSISFLCLLNFSLANQSLPVFYFVYPSHFLPFFFNSFLLIVSIHCKFALLLLNFFFASSWLPLCWVSDLLLEFLLHAFDPSHFPCFQLTPKNTFVLETNEVHIFLTTHDYCNHKIYFT